VLRLKKLIISPQYTLCCEPQALITAAIGPYPESDESGTRFQT